MPSELRSVVGEENVDTARASQVNDLSTSVSVISSVAHQDSPSVRHSWSIDTAPPSAPKRTPYRSQNGAAVGPVEHVVPDRTHTILGSREGSPSQVVRVVVPVDYPPQHIVELGRTSHGVQPTVVDDQSIVGSKFLLNKPGPKVAQLDHASASMTGRRLAQRPSPVEVAVRVTSDQEAQHPPQGRGRGEA
jgi:hypothetical protein